MNLRQMKYFLAVADTLSFSRAALLVGIAQPPLSQQIRALEVELGIELFDRRLPKNIKLAPAGRQLLPYVRRALHAATDVVDAAGALRGGAVNKISLGAGYTAILTFIPKLLNFFQQAVPRLECQVHSLVSREQIPAVLNGTIDLGIARAPVSHPELISEPLFEEAFVAAIPAGHELEGRKHVTSAELARQNLIVTVQNPSTYNLSENALSFFSNQASLNVRYRVSDLHTALSFVRGGLGVSLVPGTLASVEIDGVKLVALRGRVPLSTVSMIRHVSLDDSACKMIRNAVISMGLPAGAAAGGR